MEPHETLIQVKEETEKYKGERKVSTMGLDGGHV